MISMFEEHGLIDGKDLMERLFDDVYSRPMTLESKFRCFWVSIVTDAHFCNLEIEEAEGLFKQAFVDSILQVK